MEKNKERKPDGYWNNYNHCYEAAKECNERMEFKNKYGAAYKSSLSNGWIDDYTWLETKKRPDGYWLDYDNCFNAALECSSKHDFKKKYGRAYIVAEERGWISDYTWFEVYSRPWGYWNNYNNCYNAALECKTRAEFCEKYPGAYQRSLSNDWLDRYAWFERPKNIFEDNVDTVYGYLFEDIKVAYIGRTVDVPKRDKEHRGVVHEKRNDAVFKFSQANGVDIPEISILKSGLKIKDGLYWEDWYREYYEQLGYTMLNKGKTGVGSGSIGGMDKHSKQHCLETAIQCKSIKEYSEKYPHEYRKARDKKWFSDYTWLKREKNINGYWNNYDNCYNAALKCISRSDFQEKYSGAYKWAVKNEWINDYTWFPAVKSVKPKPKGYWNNYDNCYNAAKECKMKSHFQKKYSKAYKWSVINGWINDFTWFT